jgi:hypothetical protein
MESRLGQAEPQERDLLELLAFGEPLALAWNVWSPVRSRRAERRDGASESF